MKASVPNVETHPHTYAWFCLINKFHDSVRNSWAAGAAAKGAEKKPAAPKKEEKKEEKPAADDDELDLFGEGPSEVSCVFWMFPYASICQSFSILYLIGVPY